MGSPTPTTHIGFKASQTHYYARGQARRIGLPLTHYVVIAFANTNIDPRMIGQCFGKIRRDDFAKWTTPRRRGSAPAFTPTYSYTFENVRDHVPFMTMEPGDPHNVHVNWLVHLPASRVFDFEQRLWHWVENRTGGITGGASTIFVGPITSRNDGYNLKGALPAAVERFAGGHKYEPQGIIVGRRAGTSRNLGPTARRALDADLGIRRKRPASRPRLHLERQPVV